jgi:hypothetical protein
MSAWITSYHDLCKEIEIMEIRAEELESQMKRILQKMHNSPSMRMVASYSGMPGAGTVVIQMERLHNDLQPILEELEDIYDVLQLKVTYKARMEAKMGEFEGIEHIVAVKRDIERKPLYQIAEEMGYSYGWIRKISHKTPRHRAS